MPIPTPDGTIWYENSVAEGCVQFIIADSGVTDESIPVTAVHLGITLTLSINQESPFVAVVPS